MEEKSEEPDTGVDFSERLGEQSGGVSIEQLAERLYRKRKFRNLTLGQAGEQIGVSAATLSRFERLRLRDESASGKSIGFVPDTRTLTAITRWIDGSLGSVVERVGGEVAPTSRHPQETVPEKVDAHLRADRNLDDEAATALSQIFRMAYDQVVRRRQADEGEENRDKLDVNR